MAKKEKPPSHSAISDMVTSEQQKFLSAIDRLRELGVNEDISLPQLAVVGDQSSGKSSLLEGITGFGFPVASELCTRFVTQIVMRRAKEAQTHISIIPGTSSRSDDSLVATFKEYGHTIQGSQLETDVFAKVLAKASSLMGLPEDLESSVLEEKRFSEDVLKIEITGPDQHHLSVVDVPGLFHNPTKYQTKEDLNIIRHMINRYVRDPRTIILAVMDARNNLANQEVFKLAREADPAGVRTVGVITKCDALQAGDEDGILRIAQNKIEVLKYGWFAVRNRSTQDIVAGVSIEQRHGNERLFFSAEPWNQLRRDRVGVPALKYFLGRLLYEHIKREFPNVTREIERLHAEAQSELDAMGPPQQTSMEQRQYLVSVSTVYQKLVDDSLRGNYDPKLDADHPLKLRMHLRNNNDDFERQIRTNGHAKIFKTVTDEDDPVYGKDREISSDDIYRGAELPGTVNPILLENLFRQQSLPWEMISRVYVSKAEELIRNFITTAQSRIISEDTVREAVLAWIHHQSTSAARSVREELSRFLADERQAILQTVNHYFADTLQGIRQERVVHRFHDMGLQNGQTFIMNMDRLVKAAHLSNEDQAVNDIHDTLKAYYQVALKRFMDNIVNAVVERHLLGTNGPVKFLGPDFVSGLNDEELAAISQENEVSISGRREARRRLQMFEEALDVVNRLQISVKRALEEVFPTRFFPFL